MRFDRRFECWCYFVFISCVSVGVKFLNLWPAYVLSALKVPLNSNQQYSDCCVILLCLCWCVAAGGWVCCVLIILFLLLPSMLVC